jgi:hypothetical protein
MKHPNFTYKEGLQKLALKFHTKLCYTEFVTEENSAFQI